jgi:hypothetical protein
MLRKEEVMNRWIIIGLVCVAAIAGAQPKGNCVRLGVPLSTPSNVVSVTADPNTPGRQSSPDDVVLDVQLPKLYFDAGEAVTLTAHLHTRGGTDIDTADVAVEDEVRAGPLEQGASKGRRKGRAQGHGRHAVSLDTSPGEHYVIVYADAVVNGTSVHRGVQTTYLIATGHLRFLDVGSPHPVGELLVVPLNVVAPHGGDFVIAATIASGQTAVAQATTQVTLEPGASTVELPFAQQDMVEPGPYRLVDVKAHGGESGGLVAVPQAVGQPFQAAHADHEPPFQRNEEGAYVGVGPRFDPAAVPAMEATPGTVEIPRWPEGYPSKP